eukprot:365033-Chlamydomonas_euryale.AAC.2
MVLTAASSFRSLSSFRRSSAAKRSASTRAGASSRGRDSSSCRRRTSASRAAICRRRRAGHVRSKGGTKGVAHSDLRWRRGIYKFQGCDGEKGYTNSRVVREQ